MKSLLAVRNFSRLTVLAGSWLIILTRIAANRSACGSLIVYVHSWDPPSTNWRVPPWWDRR